MKEWPRSCSWVLDQLKLRQADNLAVRLEGLREKVIPLLGEIGKTFTEYTVHDIRHKDSVCEILGWLIPKEIMQDFSDYDIYFLVAAAYIHDVGMADINEIFDEDQFLAWVQEYGSKFAQSEHRKEYIRTYHHIRSKQYLMKHYSEYYIENPTEAEIISTIALGHRNLNDLLDYTAFSRKFMYAHNKSVNLAALAYYLQLADELDLTFERAPLLIYQSFRPKNPHSILEWEKALSIGGVGMDRSDRRKILVTALCRDRQVHRALLSLENKIQNKLDFADRILEPYQYNYFPSRILFDVRKEGYDALDLEIVFEMKSMIPLLSEHIYERKEDALREFLQNAVDACRRRVLSSKKKAREYSPKINIKLMKQDTDLVLSIEDNGEGMDENVLSNYFGKIGRSYYRSPEFVRSNPEFQSISEFGVGVLSGFMLADTIKMETKAENSPAYRLELYPSDRRILAINGSRGQTGTVISLPLKQAIEIDVIKEVERYAAHIEIPIVIDTETETRTIQQRWLGYGDFIQKYSADSEIRLELTSDDYHAIIAFQCVNHATLGEIPTQEFDEPTDEREISARFSRRGIFVQKMTRSEVADLIGIRGSIDIDVFTGDVEIDASRNRFKKNQRFARFISMLKQDIIKRLGELVENYLRKDEAAFKSSAVEILGAFVSIKKYSPTDPVRQFLLNYTFVDLINKKKLESRPLKELGESFETIRNLPPISPEEMVHFMEACNCPISDITVLSRNTKILETILGRNLPERSYKSLFAYSEESILRVTQFIEPATGSQLGRIGQVVFAGIRLFNSTTNRLFIPLTAIAVDGRSREPAYKLTLGVNINHPVMVGIPMHVSGRTSVSEFREMIGPMLLDFLIGNYNDALSKRKTIVEKFGGRTDEIALEAIVIPKIISSKGFDDRRQSAYVDEYDI